MTATTQTPESMGVRLTARSAGDMGLDGQRLGFTFQLGAVWLAGTFLIALLLEGGIVWTLVAIWCVSCLTFLAGGISRMTAAELDTGTPTNRNETWRFIMTRGLGMVFGPWAVALGVVLAGSLYAFLVNLIVGIPSVGPVLGGLIIVPTFVLVLLLISVMMNGYLLPIIMGVDDCGLVQSIRSLIATSRKAPLVLFSGYVDTIRSFLPMLAFSALITALGLVGTYLICVGMPSGDDLQMQGGLSGALESASVFLIVFSWISFVTVFMTGSFAMLYYQVSMLARPDAQPSEETAVAAEAASDLAPIVEGVSVPPLAGQAEEPRQEEASDPWAR